MVHMSKHIFFIVWLIFQTLLRDAHQAEHKEKHFLHYKFTVLTKADTFPEFSAEGVCDDRQIKHYNNEERVWILTEDDWTEPPDPSDSRDWFIHQIRTLTNCTNSQCSELHVLQRIIGCELEKLPDGTVNLTVFDEYGFDGEDFISFNSDTMKWIEKNPKAKETKEKWDLHTERNQFIKYFLKNCTDWISKFNNSKKSSPDVHVSVRKAPDDDSNLVLTCLATGFYPREVQMNIRLNRINLEDQTSSEIRPNDDETFQMRISVKIDRKHEGSYDCHVIHSSLTEPVTVKWDFDSETESRWRFIAGAAAAVVAGLGFLFWLCLKVQKVQSHNVVESQTSVPNPDTEQAAVSLFNYETGVTLLTGI
ncbi:zinc-alpha-2-glycoprotein-like [Megalobrama amblycephala]|uniref:zinc-alpha-2-glycoprotein-like n=1 Tax=Megalobrama amblycephala TaxID=75352 RepID=UPI0020140F8C|nr:zinc-alpha-2-glycoprotein-like [Megalobrama amblycephala]